MSVSSIYQSCNNILTDTTMRAPPNPVTVLKIVVENLARKKKIPHHLDRTEVVNSLMMLLAFRMRTRQVKVLSPDAAQLAIPRDTKTGNIYITSFNVPGHVAVNVIYVNSPNRKDNINSVSTTTFQFSVKCGPTVDHHGELFSRPKWSGRLAHYEAKSYTPKQQDVTASQDICFVGLIHQLLFLADQLDKTGGDFKAAVNNNRKARYTKPCTSERLAVCIGTAVRDICGDGFDAFKQWSNSTRNIHPGPIRKGTKVAFVVEQMLAVSDESAKNHRALKQHKKEFAQVQSVIQCMQSQIVALQEEVATLRGQAEARDSDLTVRVCPECGVKIRGLAALKNHLEKRQQSGICDVNNSRDHRDHLVNKNQHNQQAGSSKVNRGRGKKSPATATTTTTTVRSPSENHSL